MSYIKGTGRSKKRKTKAYYKKEKSGKITKGLRKGQKRSSRQDVLSELQNENVIYYLAKQPVYIHSNEIYYKQAMNTAKRILQQDLVAAVKQVHQLIPDICNILETKINQMVSICGKSNWQEFKQWWESDVMNTAIEDDGTAIYYLSLLEKIKQQATLIGLYKHTRSQNKDGNKNMTASGVKKLIDMGLVSADFTGVANERVGDKDLIKNIYDQQKKDLKTLTNYLTSVLSPHLPNSFTQAYEELKKGVAYNPYQTFAKPIGRIAEQLSGMFVKQTLDGFTVVMENVAAENNKENNSKTFKADTKATISLGDLNFSFLISDKTGLKTLFGTGGKIIGFIDNFTAGIKSDTLDIGNIQTDIDFNKIDPNLNDLFQYIIKNANAFNKQEVESKEIIISFFAWAKLLTELIGTKTNIADMPPVIKMFNRLYKTSDIITRFMNVDGIKILQYVNKTYLQSFYKVYEAGKAIDKVELYKAKKTALANMHSRSNYIKLKLAIDDILTNLSNTVATQTFSTSYNILLDNVKNIT